MEATGRYLSGVPVTEQEWKEIQEWAKDPIYVAGPSYLPGTRYLQLPEAWCNALARHNKSNFEAGGNRWNVTTPDDQRRQQRLNVLKNELLQHRKRVQRAQKEADIEHELDNMLLHGALATTNRDEQDRVIGALRGEDRNSGKDEIEATQYFTAVENTTRRRPVHLRYIDDAKSGSDSHTGQVHQDQPRIQKADSPAHKPPTGHTVPEFDCVKRPRTE